MAVVCGRRSFSRHSAASPWPADGPTGGTPPQEAADAIFARVCGDVDDRLRVLVGDDTPVQVRAALDLRRSDYARDPRCAPDDR